MADCKSVSCKCLDASYVNANKFIASRCAHTTDIIDRIRRDLTEANELITQWNATIGDNSELSSYVFNNNFTEEYTNADIGAQFSSAFSDYPAVKNQLDPIKANIDAFRDEVEPSLISTLALLSPEAVEIAKRIVATDPGVSAFQRMMDKVQTFLVAIKDVDNQFAAAVDKDTQAKTTAAQQQIINDSGLKGDELVAALDEMTAAFEEDARRIKSGGVGGRIKSKNFVPMPFREQCFIQGGIHYLVNLRRQPGFAKKNILPGVNPKHPYGCLMAADISPFGFVNRLTQSPRASALLDLPPEIISQLQPTVRLYKIEFSDDGGRQEREVPIIFPASTSAANVAEVFKNKKKRGFGVGLKSFDWSYDGSDPFAIKKSITAQVTIHAATFSELLQDRGGYRYADLALKTGKDVLEVPPACPDTISNGTMHTGANLDFRLKAVVGYAIPPNLAVTRGMKTTIQAAISDSFVTLELTPTIHEFEFDDSGRVSFTVNYLAYIENYFDDYYYDIFSAGYGNKVQSYVRHIEKKVRASHSTNSPNAPTLSADPDEPKTLKAEQVKNLQSLLHALFKNNRMYFVKIPWGKLSDASLDPTSVLPIFNNNGDLSNGADVAGSIKQLKEDASKASNGIAKKEMLEKVNFLAAAQAGLSTTDVYEQVSFFYLYDLIDVILDGIGTLLAEYYPKAIGRLSFNEREDPGGAILRQEKEMLFRMRENFKKLRVLLGPLEIRDPSNPSSRMNISIGEIPISNKYFIEWMTSKMLAQERTGMTLTRFMNLFIKNYLRNFLNDTGCNGNKTQQPVSLYNASISSYSRSAARDELTTALIAQGQYPGVSRGVDITGGIDYFSLNTVAAARNAGIPVSPVLNTMGSRIISGPASKGQKLAKNYMIFYAGRTRPDDMMVGNHGDDTAAGIFHYMIGKDRGLVKNIQLVKTSATGHKEVRFEQEGYDGLLQLREVYNVTVDSFLMPNAFPGTYIFVDPRGFAPDTRGYQYVDPTNPDKKVMIDKYELSRYGIGGYYMVIKTEHHIAEGEFSSKIHAAWVAQIHKKATGAQVSTGAKIESHPAASTPTKCDTRRATATPAASKGNPGRDTVGEPGGGDDALAAPPAAAN